MELKLDWFERLLVREGVDATSRPSGVPIVLERAQGSLLWDTEGSSYIDLIAGFGSLPLGHKHPKVLETIVEHCTESGLIQGLGDVHASRFKIEFLETLLSFLPSYLNRALLAVTGSQAVEQAMKTAMLATKGSGFIAFTNAYHGTDFGPLALTGHKHFRGPFQSWLNQDSVRHLPYMCDVSLVKEALSEFRKKGIKMAGIIVEPVLGRGGFFPASMEWLKALKTLSEQENCLLIFDEVFTGFGRCGKVTFAEDLLCDLVCFGKAIGGGMPLSACVGTERVMSAWPVNYGEAINTGTFFGHALSCRVGRRTLEILREEGLVTRAANLGVKINERLESIFSKSPKIREIRVTGLMVAVEFWDAKDSLRALTELNTRGVILIPCGPSGECLSWTPALNIPDALIDGVIEKMKDVMILLEKSHE